jgi:hypothetical protein
VLLLKRPPNENVRPAALNAPDNCGGTGMSWSRECGEKASSGGGISVEEGRVDEELSRVEVELSYVRALSRFQVSRLRRESMGRERPYR